MIINFLEEGKVWNLNPLWDLIGLMKKKRSESKPLTLRELNELPFEEWLEEVHKGLQELKERSEEKEKKDAPLSESVPDGSESG